VKLALLILGVYLLWWNRDEMLNPTPPPKLTAWEWVLDLTLKTLLILVAHCLISVLVLAFD